jgi:hypothetical protein
MRSLGSPRNRVPEREQEAAERDMISPRTLWPDPLRLDQYPPGLLLWRSLTQWMGGLGMGPNPMGLAWHRGGREAAGPACPADSACLPMPGPPSYSAATGWLPPRAKRFQCGCPGLVAGHGRPDQLLGDEC